MIGSQRTERPRGGRMTIARSRGAVSGLLLVLLGIWGALIPFIGPNFDFAFTPDQPWTWTMGRGWLEVLPGVVTVIGGLLLFTSRNRATAMLGGWLTVAAGAWFVIGRALAGPLGLGEAGSPVAAAETKRVWLDLTHFYGLGALVIFLGALALGRVSVRSVRDVEYATRTLTDADGVPVRTGPVPVGPTANTPVGEAPTEVIDGNQRVERRRGLRGLLRGRGDRTLVRH